MIQDETRRVANGFLGRAVAALRALAGLDGDEVATPLLCDPDNDLLRPSPLDLRAEASFGALRLAAGLLQCGRACLLFSAIDGTDLLRSS